MQLYVSVADGGSLHASDQAYDFIEVLFPDRINFLGDDEARGAADEGAAGEVPALVLDTDIAAALGHEAIALRYNLDTWSVMVDVADGVDIYIEADARVLAREVPAAM